MADQAFIRQRRLAALDRLSGSPQQISAPSNNPTSNPTNNSTAYARDNPSSHPTKVAEPFPPENYLSFINAASIARQPSIHTVPPAYKNTVPPSYRNTVPPASIHTVPPASRNTVPPSSRNTVPPASRNTVPPSSSNIHTLSSLKCGRPGSTGGGRLASNSRTQVITQEHEVYIRLPSKTITSEQLVQFIRTQFGICVSVRHMNSKHQKYQMNERNFCFVDCESKADMERLINEMNDTTIGQWEDPLLVKRKMEHE